MGKGVQNNVNETVFLHRRCYMATWKYEIFSSSVETYFTSERSKRVKGNRKF